MGRLYDTKAKHYTYWLISTFNFFRKDSLQKEDLNKDLLFDVFNSAFPFPVDNKVKLENQNSETKVDSNVDNIPEADFDMIQVSLLTFWRL